MAPGCAAFWVPDQNAPARGFLAQARSTARAATAARRTSQEGLRATEVWIPDQTSGAQAPYFGGLLGPAVRSAAKAATPPQFALRARGQCPLPVCPSPASWQARPDRAQCRGVKATEVWIPDQTSGAQAPFFGGLLGPTVRSAAKAATPPQFALRARGQCPLPVCPSPASWQAQPGRAQCRGVKATEVWIPDQTSGAQAPYFGGLLGPAARSAAKAATPPQFALRARGQCPLPVCPSPASWQARPDRAQCRGVKATEVWIPDQTSGAQAPFFGGLLGPTVRSAAKAATPPQFALRARGQCPLPVCPSPASWQAQPGRAQCRGVKATEVWIPDQTSGAQAPYFGGLLGPAARSAAKAATPPQFALRARGQCPLPVCPSPASLVRQSDRALCSGVLRRSPGRVGGARLDEKQLGAGTDMRVFSTQPKAGTLPGDT